MRLTARFIVALALATLVVLGVNAVFRVRRESSFFAADARRDAEVAGDVLARAVAETWHRDGEQAARILPGKTRLHGDSARVRWIDLEPSARAPLTAAEVDELRKGRVISKELGADSSQPTTLYTYVLLPPPAPRPVALELSQSLAEEHMYVRDSVRHTLVSTAVLLLACAAAATALGVHFIGRPARALVEKARRVGAGDLSGRLVLDQRDEFGVLAQELNAMCERLGEAQAKADLEAKARLATLEQLRHADRLATVGRLASGVAHELGTPLNVVSGRAQLIAMGELDGPAVAESAEIIAAQSSRMAAIIRQLLDFARRSTPATTQVDVASLARQSVKLLESLASKSGVTLGVKVSEKVDVLADAAQLQQVLTNLIVNAIQASPKGSVTVNVSRGPASDAHPTAHAGPFAILRVRDDGAGMDEATRSRVFEPFFTTKGVGEGTGLGLSVAHGIVQDHGGWIEVQSAPGAGSVFTTYIPASSEEASA